MGNFDNFGGLTSITGSIGGGSGTYAGDRGILFPEFNQWAEGAGAFLKIETNAKLGTKGGITETITIDVDFNDGLWRPSSTIIANSGLPKKGDEHPTISRCLLKDLSVKNYNGQPDHFRATLNYGYTDGGVSSSSGAGVATTPLEEAFLISWTPTIRKQITGEDLTGKAIRNPNGEAYEAYRNTVRLDGVCTWNQNDWDETEATKWTGVINNDTWGVDNYKFDSETILCNYVVGNLNYYTDEQGQRVPYYAMQAGISFNPERWSDNRTDIKGSIGIRRQGSFYFMNSTKKETLKRPTKKSQYQYEEWDLDENGVLKSKDSSMPTVEDPDYDFFKMYRVVKFNFVDR